MRMYPKRMYRFIREYGITATFVLHWLLYYFALFNKMMDWGMNGSLLYSIQWGSLPLLGIGVAVTFSKCIDDCNVKLLNACIFSMTLRFVVIVLKPWGFDSSSTVMIFCGVFMVVWFAIEFVNKKSKNRYFKH